MDLSYGEENEAFREEVQDFLTAHWTDANRKKNPVFKGNTWLVSSAARMDEDATRFRLQAIERGYLYRNVPQCYGGGEQPWDPLKEIIIAEEFEKAQAPTEVMSNGPTLLVPTLLDRGTEEQKQRFIRNALLGTEYWCQGYSEPGAGSDLASLRTRGVLDGDHWIVNGHKIWTTLAHISHWMFCLVRTEPDAPKHKGISYLLIDMKTPGITVRPLVQITGEAEFNEVFLDDVRVPATNIVGKRGEGWAVSMTTLKHERQFMGGSLIGRRMLDGVTALAQHVSLRGQPAIMDPIIANRLVELEGRLRAHMYHVYRLLTMGMRNEDLGLAGMVGKLYGSTLNYDITKLAMDIVSDRGALWEDSGPASGIAPYVFMGSFGLLIGGGTTNMQRNMIAERGLGLPR
jgi:alkylation response protein AidB-like acyl-CoA dehydrogenase